MAEQEAIPRPGERLDDLQRGGLFILQNPSLFCFGMDAVLLADYVRCGKEDKILDLCCGNGIIPLLLCAREDYQSITGLELLEENTDLAERSVRFNGLGDKIRIITGDVKEAGSIFEPASFNVVTANPPYMPGGAGLKSTNTARRTARHETDLTFEDVCAAAAFCLKSSGKFFLVHRPARLPELFVILKKHGLEPKRMRLVYPSYGKKANLVLLECVKGAGPELLPEPPLIVYNEDGTYTEEILKIYNGE